MIGVKDKERLLPDSLTDEVFFQRLNSMIASGECKDLFIDDLLASSIRLAKPNAYAHFNVYSYPSTVSLINNLMSLRNAERLANADGRLSIAAIALAVVSLAVSSYDAFVH